MPDQLVVRSNNDNTYDVTAADGSFNCHFDVNAGTMTFAGPPRALSIPALLKLINDIAANAPVMTIIADLVGIFAGSVVVKPTP